MFRRILLNLLIAVPAIFASETLVLSGRIPCMGQIVMAGDSTAGRSDQTVQRRVIADETGRASVLLQLRTNCPFRVAARLTDLTLPVQIVSGTVSAAGGGGRLTPRALQTQVEAVEVPAGFARSMIQGPAISRGGNNFTSDNAVLVEVVLQFPKGVPGGLAEFSLKLGN